MKIRYDLSTRNVIREAKILQGGDSTHFYPDKRSPRSFRTITNHVPCRRRLSSLQKNKNT